MSDPSPPPGAEPEAQDLVAAAVGALGLEGLREAAEEANRLVGDEGIRHGADEGRDWVVDPLPIVIGHDEWQQLEAGLQQRARLLSLVAADLYGEQRLVSSGVVPAEIIWGHTGFLHRASGIRPPLDVSLPMAATDLGRSADGRWVVLDDRTGDAPGAGYAMTNRRITSRVMGELHSRARIARLGNYFSAWRAGLGELAPPSDEASRGVLLWSGPGSATAYEQGVLATLLGYSLVEAEDLLLREGRVWINSQEGRTRVDVILRRVRSELSDPLEFRPDSQVGLAGLLEATRLGNVAVANPIGSDVLENPALQRLLPDLAHQILGEDILLDDVESWWCGDAAQRSHVLANLGSLVVKPLVRNSRGGTRQGWELTAAQRQDLADAIGAEPWAWCAQDPLDVATAPVVTASGLEHRRVVLRCFATHVNTHWEVMPGGLARVAPDAETFLTTFSAGALSKDVWVLDPADAPIETWHQGLSFGRSRAPGTLTLAPRVADNLFWLGRYLERADGVVRLLRHGVESAQDNAGRPDSLGGRALSVVLAAGEAITGLDLASSDLHGALPALRRALTDRTRTGTAAHAVDHLVRAAHTVPDILAADAWPVISRLERLTADVAGPRDPSLRLQELQTTTLALVGIHAESMTRDATWAFIDAGLRIERAQRTLGLLGGALGEDRAAIIDAVVCDALLEIGDSTITFRRRSAAGQAHVRPEVATVELLVTDPANPRSVSFQLTRLAGALRVVGDDDLADRVSALPDVLARPDALESLAGARTAFRGFCSRLQAELRELSDELGRTHFARSAPRRATLSGWEAS